MTDEIDENPFTDVYQLRMTHAVVLFLPSGIQGAVFHGAWWPALWFGGLFALLAVLKRFRFLVRNTSWFLGSVLWNVIIQIALLLIGLFVHRLWVPMLGIAWVVVTLFSDSPELSELEKKWRLPSWR